MGQNLSLQSSEEIHGTEFRQRDAVVRRRIFDHFVGDNKGAGVVQPRSDALLQKDLVALGEGRTFIAFLLIAALDAGREPSRENAAA